MSRWDRLRADGDVIDLSEEMMGLTLDIVGRALWVFAAPIHQYLISRGLKRVARSAAQS